MKRYIASNIITVDLFSGVLMSRRIFYFSLLSLSISACSNIDTKLAVGDFDYVKLPEAKELKVVNGMKTPEKQKEFEINNNINHKGSIGEDVDVRAPTLVLPLAAASRVIPESEDAIIWFDQVLEKKDLLAFIKLAIKSQLSVDNVNLNTLDETVHLYESDWFHKEKESGWLFTSIESAESMRFRYQLEQKPHGRSVSLRVALVDYMKTDERGGAKEVNLIDKQRAEVSMLNEIIAQVDYMYRLEERELRIQQVNQKIVSIGENTQSEPAYIIDMKLDHLWSNLPSFFEKHGFTMTDLNESKKIYFVDFVRPDLSVWDKIWGDEVPVIDIDDAKYQFVLSESDNKTAVTIYNADGNVLPVETLNRVFDVVEAGLSFNNIY